MSDETHVASLARNQFLQASHNILQLLEQAKARVERFVDLLPNIFAVIDRDGNLLKGNTQLAQLMGCELEETLGRQLKTIFQPATWSMFKSHFDRLAAGDSGGLSPFELAADAVPGSPLIAWNATAFAPASGDAGPWYGVFGVDVTAIREYEAQLSQIFTTIPLAIFKLNEKLQVVAPYSRFAEVLFGRTDLAGRTIFELVFEPAALSLVQREHAGNLANVIGFPDFQFDLIRESLVRVVHLPGGEGGTGKWLGLNYDPIMENGTIAGLLVVIEDRTAMELARQAGEARGRTEEVVVQRFLAVKQIEPDLRDAILMDLAAFFAPLDDQINRADRGAYMRSLHSIKGTARVAGLTSLMGLAHKVEDCARDLQDGRWSETGRAAYAAMVEEWEELKPIARSFGHGPAIDSQIAAPAANALLPVTHLEPKVRLSIAKTSIKLGKAVDVTFAWDGLALPATAQRALGEALLHLATNAVDHGIEPPEERAEAGKKPRGQVRLSGKAVAGGWEIYLEDDGRGINADRVRDAAVRRQVVTEVEAAGMSDEQVRMLVFRPELTTRDEITEISGRGAGLAAVADIVTGLGGEVHVESRCSGGTTFVLKIPELSSKKAA